MQQGVNQTAALVNAFVVVANQDVRARAIVANAFRLKSRARCCASSMLTFPAIHSAMNFEGMRAALTAFVMAMARFCSFASPRSCSVGSGGGSAALAPGSLAGAGSMMSSESLSLMSPPERVITHSLVCVVSLDRNCAVGSAPIGTTDVSYGSQSRAVRTLTPFSSVSS